MLDPRLLREDEGRVRQSLIDRGYPTTHLDEFLQVDREWRAKVDEANHLKQRRNVAGQRVAGLAQAERERTIEEMRGLSDRVKVLDAEIRTLEAERDALMLRLPNLPDPEVPKGVGDEANPTVRSWGEPRKHPFLAKTHIELGESLGIIDFERGAKLAGSGFYVLRGAGARLERALINYMLDLHISRGYTELFPPALTTEQCVVGTGQLPRQPDDMYHIERDGLWLNPTAEVPVTNYHANEILEAAELPRYYTAYLPSFRREAGRHSELRGILRVHQFNKVELVKFVFPEKSAEELESMVAEAETVLHGLELPHRVRELTTGNLGFAAAKTYDLEAYAPGVDLWLEVSSCTNCTDFQARRAMIKFRRAPHLKSEFLHTLNGSGIALPRTMAALLEHNQRSDGSVEIPKVLRERMGGLGRLELPAAPRASA